MNTMYNTNKLSVVSKSKIIIWALVMVQFSLYAQDLNEEKQEVIKNFEATLGEATKIEVKPIVAPVQKIKKVYDYDITIRPLEVSYADPVIKPIAAEPDAPFESMPFWAQLGFGNLKNAKARILYYNTDENKFDYSLDLKHYNVDNSAKLARQKMSDSDLTLGVKYRFAENKMLYGQAGSSFIKRNFYSINGEAPINELQNGRRRVNTFVKAGVKNLDEKKYGISYDVNLKTSIVAINNPSTTESFIALGGVASKKVSSFSLQLPINASYSKMTRSNQLSLFNVAPTLGVMKNKIHVNVGVEYYADNRKLSKLWPKLLVDYKLAKNQIHLFLKTDVAYQENNLHNLTLYNPWINTDINALTSHVATQVSGGLNGALPALSYEIEVGNETINNLAILTNLVKVYSPEVRQIKSANNFVKISTTVLLKEYLKLNAQLIKNNYDEIQTSLKAYGLPSFQLKAKATVSLWKDKVALSPILVISDKTYTIIKGPAGGATEVPLNNQVDFSTHLHFWPSKKVGIYAEANNILDNKYAFSYGYPSVGINFNGGVLVKF
jgi:hypothetical protein